MRRISRARGGNGPSFRLIGWLSVVGLLALSIMPGTVLANDLHQSLPISYLDSEFQASGEDCDVQELDEPGEVLWHFVQTKVDFDADVPNSLLTLTFTDPGGHTFTVTVPADFQNGQTLHWHVITNEDTLIEASSNVETDGNLNLSHTCHVPYPSWTPGPTDKPTPSPTDEATPSPTPTEEATPSPTPTEEATPSPSPSGEVEGATGTPTPTFSPTGGVEGATGTPNATLPPTDTLNGSNGGGTDNWRIVLVAMAGVLAGLLLLTPSPKRVRRD